MVKPLALNASDEDISTQSLTRFVKGKLHDGASLSRMTAITQLSAPTLCVQTVTDEGISTQSFTRFIKGKLYDGASLSRMAAIAQFSAPTLCTQTVAGALKNVPIEIENWIETQADNNETKAIRRYKDEEFDKLVKEEETGNRLILELLQEIEKFRKAQESNSAVFDKQQGRTKKLLCFQLDMLQDARRKLLLRVVASASATERSEETTSEETCAVVKALADAMDLNTMIGEYAKALLNQYIR